MSPDEFRFAVDVEFMEAVPGCVSSDLRDCRTVEDGQGQRVCPRGLQRHACSAPDGNIYAKGLFSKVLRRLECPEDGRLPAF
jgi:hypothetical protein